MTDQHATDLSARGPREPPVRGNVNYGSLFCQNNRNRLFLSHNLDHDEEEEDERAVVGDLSEETLLQVLARRRLRELGAQ